MILAADSGSTKCDWMLVHPDGKRELTHTMGFNPFFHSSNLVQAKLLENDLFQKLRNKVDEVYFYGAGCSSSQRNEIIRMGLANVFVNAKEIVVDHDLKGAALATTSGEPGIACIIGTGSNSCFFDGNKVHEEIPALGYVLGDEGSGSYFGKILLSEWLYNRMPEELAKEFGEEYSLSKECIFSAVHKEPNPNVYLASFMKFPAKHKEHPYIKKMIYQGLAKFVDIHVWCYANYREVPVNFVGSVAFYFRDILNEVARYHGFKIDKIERRPIDSLTDYHTKTKLQTK